MLSARVATASARIAAAVAVLLTAATSTANAQPTTGDLQGTVVAASGQILQAVTVTVTNTETGFTRETFTGDTGFFTVPALPPAIYEVQASSQGYATQRQSAVMVHAGQVATLRLTLGVAPAPETITAAGAPPMVDHTRSHVSATVSTTEVEHLPTAGRNAVALSLLTPAVTFDPRDDTVSVSGLSGSFNRFIVDGADLGGRAAGPWFVPQEVAQSVQVHTNAYTAEYGRALGGIVQVVTRSGSNELAGSVYEFHGKGPVGTGGSLSGNQFGGTVGGPLAPDRHFAFGLYDGQRRSGSSGDIRGDRDVALVKTDHQMSGSHRYALRYGGERWRRRGFDASGAIDGGVAARRVDTTVHGFTATALNTFGTALFNEARLHAGRDRESGETGWDVFGTAEATVNRWQLANTLTWVNGAHKVKAGVDAGFDRVTFVRAAGDTTEPRTTDYGLFAQDEWRLDATLTLNVGLRYDVQSSSILDDAGNFGPRLGVAWAPFDRPVVFRAGYGVMYGRTPWPMLASAQSSTGTLVVFDTSYQSPRVQQASVGFEWEWMRSTALSVNYLFARGDRLPRPVERSLGDPRSPAGFTRVVAYESTAESRYQGMTVELLRRFAQGHQYRLSYTLGRGTDSAPDATALVPGSLDDRSVLPAAVSATERSPGRTDRRHSFVGSVIYSTNRFADRYDGVMESLAKDWMLSAVFRAQTALPLSAYVLGDLNGDGNRFNDLAPGTTRHDGRQRASITLDPRLARELDLERVRLTLIWEAFNLFNRPNDIVVNDVQYRLRGTELDANPLFGQPLAEMERRTMKLAVRLSF